MQKNRFLIIIVFLALITAGCSGAGVPGSAPEQAGSLVFKTPEESITSYLEGVAQGDIQKILQACAINEMSEKFKFDLYTERMGGSFLPAQSLSPTGASFYVEMNKMQLTAQIINQVKIFTYDLLSREKLNDGSLVTKMDAEGINNFMKDVDPKRLSSLAIKKIGLPDKTRMTGAKYLENAVKSALVYGADDSTERVALFSFEQNYFYLGFTLLRYGENWKINSPTSMLADIKYGTGVLQKTTVDEFESMINGD